MRAVAEPPAAAAVGGYGLEETQKAAAGDGGPAAPGPVHLYRMFRASAGRAAAPAWVAAVRSAAGGCGGGGGCGGSGAG